MINEKPMDLEVIAKVLNYEWIKWINKTLRCFCD